MKTEMKIQRGVIDLFPRVKVAAIRVEGMSDALKQIDVERLMKNSLDQLSNHEWEVDKIGECDWVQTWREAYSKSGYSPGKYRSSIEALVRRALKSPDSIRTGIDVVDVYNAVSLENIAPLGGYDVQKLPHQNIEMRFASPSEDSFEPLGGKPADFPLKQTGIVYACGNHVVCYGFNHRDSSRTCLDAGTSVGLFCGEAVDEATSERLHRAMLRLREILSAAGAQVSEVLVVDATKPEAQVA